MARDFLAISGTGVPVERLFSTGAELMSAYRHRMTHQTVRELMCLKNWMRASKNDISNEFLEALKYKLIGEEQCDEPEQSEMTESEIPITI